METVTFVPQLSELQLTKRNTMQEVFEQIELLAGEDSRDATKAKIAESLLEEMRNNKPLEGRSLYAKEQALAKIAEYYKLESEVHMRRQEIESILPGILKKSAANDEQFAEIQDTKYTVA
jgi:ATP-dependent Lon protease